MNYSDLFARTELLIGNESMQRITTTKVILFGIGGVGSWCAEALIRSGILHLTIVDSDRVAVANINRQLPATINTIGELKVDVLKKRLLEINPFATINSIPEIYSAESYDSFELDHYDYIVDAIDSLSHKAHLLITASKTNATIYSSMGAGLKFDPQEIKVAEFWKVKGCKLAAALRGKMRQGERPAKKIQCVYSEELLENKGEGDTGNTNEYSSFKKARINGTIVHITAIYGFTLSGLVIQDIANHNSSTNNITNMSANKVINSDH